MKKNWILIAVGLIVAVLAVAAVACGDDNGDGNGDGGPTATEGAPAPEGDRLQRVKDRGKLICASRIDLPGVGFLTADGENSGYDIDFCRAVAAAIFGDPTAIEIVVITTAERGPTLQTGEVDVVFRTVTWTSSREAQWGEFIHVMFYDGQGFLVRKDAGFTSALDLDGASVCVTSGTTTELNLADYFRENNMELETVVFEETSAVYDAFFEGRCDAATSDTTLLGAGNLAAPNPDDNTLLPEVISKEPLSPAVPHGDESWGDLVQFVMWVLINAEELGVTQDNVEDMAANSESILIRRMLGVEGDFGAGDVGLADDFAMDVIKGVGNYADIYDRHLGPGGDGFVLPRGLNDLWTNGGLIYAPPLR